MTSSCSVMQQEKSPIDDRLDSSLESLCLSGSGKGRITYGRNKHLFRYESLWRPDKDQWSLAVEIPLRGEKILHLYYPDFSQGRFSMGGGFFHVIMRGLDKDKRTKKRHKALFRETMRLLAYLLDLKDSWLEQGQSGSKLLAKRKKECQASQKEGTLVCRPEALKKQPVMMRFGSETFEISTNIIDKFSVEIHLGGLEAGKYERITAKVRQLGNHGPRSGLFELKLFQDQCD